MRHTVTLTMTRIPWWLRLRYTWLGIHTTADSLSLCWRLAHLIPYWPRRLHRWIAAGHGFYWLPCVLCGREYGGHEPGGSVPDPTDERLWVAICPRCTRRRRPNHRRNPR